MELYQWSTYASVDDIAGLDHDSDKAKNAVNFALLSERKRAAILPELESLTRTIDYFSHAPPPPTSTTITADMLTRGYIFVTIWIVIIAALFLATRGG